MPECLPIGALVTVVAPECFPIGNPNKCMEFQHGQNYIHRISLCYGGKFKAVTLLFLDATHALEEILSKREMRKWVW